MQSGLNGRVTPQVDPINDLERLGFIGVPGVFSKEQLARLGILAAGVLSQYSYPSRTNRENLLGTQSMPDFQSDRIGSGLRPVCGLHHANGFTQMSALKELSAKIFEQVRMGLRVEAARTGDGTRNGKYLSLFVKS